MYASGLAFCLRSFLRLLFQKSILFRLASENDVAHIEKIVQKRNSKDGSIGNRNNSQNTYDNNDKDIVKTVNVTHNESIGIKFATSPDGYGLIVSEFIHSANDTYAGIQQNSLLSHVNGKCVLGENGSGKEKALCLLESEGAARPLSLGFVKPYLYNIIVEKSANAFGGPSELVFAEQKQTVDSSSKENRLILEGFSPAEGAAETGNVFVGDNLVFINGIPVGAGCRLTDGRKAKCPPLGKSSSMLEVANDNVIETVYLTCYFNIDRRGH